MSEQVHVELPLPPSSNHCYVNALHHGRRQRVLTAAAKSWMASAAMLAKCACRRAGWKPVEDKVVVELRVAWPDHRKRDTSNLHKLLGDALEGVVYTNDRYALLRDMDYAVDRKRPRLDITFYVREES